MSSICAPAPIKEIKKFYKCPKGKTKRLHRVRIYEWYGPSAKCLKCGRISVWD